MGSGGTLSLKPPDHQTAFKQQLRNEKAEDYLYVKKSSQSDY